MFGTVDFKNSLSLFSSQVYDLVYTHALGHDVRPTIGLQWHIRSLLFNDAPFHILCQQIFIPLIFCIILIPPYTTIPHTTLVLLHSFLCLFSPTASFADVGFFYTLFLTHADLVTVCPTVLVFFPLHVGVSAVHLVFHGMLTRLELVNVNYCWFTSFAFWVLFVMMQAQLFKGAAGIYRERQKEREEEDKEKGKGKDKDEEKEKGGNGKEREEREGEGGEGEGKKEKSDKDRVKGEREEEEGEEEEKKEEKKLKKNEKTKNEENKKDDIEGDDEGEEKGEEEEEEGKEKEEKVIVVEKKKDKDKE